MTVECPWVVVTRPVRLCPRMNSRNSTNAYSHRSYQRLTHVYASRTAHPVWLLLWDEVTGALDEHVRPVSFLVYDPRERSRIIEPGCRRPSREALNAAKRCILSVGSSYSML